MASGRLNLVVRGLQDELVSGSPSMSFFNKTFSKESNYEIFIRDCATETNNKLNYGETLRFKVPRVGDLISKIFLRLILPATYLYTNLKRVYTDNFVLYSLLETVDIYIGGQLIERLTGEYIHNYIKLYFSRNEFNSVVSTSEIDVEAGSQGYIRYDQFCLLPLPFYFYNNPGKEIPLLALSKHDVEVVIKFTPKPSISGLPDLTAFSMPVEFINIDEETKKQFSKKGVMYKIEQVQMEHGYIDSSESIKRIPVNFINPVRELSVCIQQTSYIDLENARYIKYFCNYRNENENSLYSNNEVGYYLQGHHIYGLDMLLNGNKIIDRNSSGHSRYLSAYIPQKYYTNPDNAQFFKQYVYPFALNPIHKNSVGHVNMSRIRNKEIILYMTPSDVNRTYRIYATSYNIFMIKDGISGLLFTHNSEYKNNIPRGISGVVAAETNTPPTVIPPQTGGETFYYAVQTDQPMLGVQLYENYNPSFPNSLLLSDNEQTQILSGENSFFSNVDILNTDVYGPASKITFFDDIDTNINLNGSEFLDRYHVELTSGLGKFIYSTQKTNALFVRTSFKTHTSSPGTTSYNPVITNDRLEYSNLNTTETINIYYSTEFFDTSDIAGWIASATRIQKTIRTDYISQSDGYYYLADIENVDGLFRYDNVVFARTYDYRIFFNVAISEGPDVDNNSVVQIDFSDVPSNRTRNIKIYRSSAKTTLITDFTSSDVSTTGTITFIESRLRTTQTYYAVYSDGSVTIETNLPPIESGIAIDLSIENSYISLQETGDLIINFTLLNITEIAGTLKTYTTSDLSESDIISTVSVSEASEDIQITQLSSSIVPTYNYYVTLTYLYGDFVSSPFVLSLPVFNTLTEDYNNSTGVVTLSGTMSKSTTVNVYSTSHTGTLLDTTTTSGSSNSFTLTSSTVNRYYYLLAEDNNYPRIERPLSTVVSMSTSYNSTNNTSTIKATYNNIYHLGAASVTIELATNSSFSSILKSQTVNNGTTSTNTGNITYNVTLATRTYYIRISSSGFLPTTYTQSLTSGIKADPNTGATFEMRITTFGGDVDIHQITGFTMNNKTQSPSYTIVPADKSFSFLFDNPFQYGSHYHTFNGASNKPIYTFRYGSSYGSTMTIYTDSGDPPSSRISNLKAYYNGNLVVTYSYSSQSLVTSNSRTRYRAYYTASVNYGNAP